MHIITIVNIKVFINGPYRLKLLVTRSFPSLFIWSKRISIPLNVYLIFIKVSINNFMTAFGGKKTIIMIVRILEDITCKMIRPTYNLN